MVPSAVRGVADSKCLSTILGDMLLRVANHRVVLGDYNEAMMGKLVTVLEEATFVGDRANFDKMKELITGEKILINPKFKAPMSVDNYSRLVVISNHDHFMYIKPGDRRYTVLESGPAWKNEPKKFEALLDQWNRGGAARFVYTGNVRSCAGRAAGSPSRSILARLTCRGHCLRMRIGRAPQAAANVNAMRVASPGRSTGARHRRAAQTPLGPCRNRRPPAGGAHRQTVPCSSRPRTMPQADLGGWDRAALEVHRATRQAHTDGSLAYPNGPRTRGRTVR